MFYRTENAVLFRLDKVLAVHPLDWDNLEGAWVVRLEGLTGDELGARLSATEAREVVELLEARFGLV